MNATRSVLESAQSDDGIPQGLIDAVRPIFAQAIWAWYDKNRDRVLVAKRILFFSFRVTLGDLLGEGIVTEIAGARPAPP